MSMNERMGSTAYERHLLELQTVDFVLVELTLYLDTHPNDVEALTQFKQFEKRKQALMRTIETSYGPLQEYGNSPTGDEWSWSQAPWPWQV